MSKEVAALAEYRLERSRDTYEDGNTLLQRGSLAGAMNRYYYAAFYAARALLATVEGVKSAVKRFLEVCEKVLAEYVGPEQKEEPTERAERSS